MSRGVSSFSAARAAAGPRRAFIGIAPNTLPLMRRELPSRVMEFTVRSSPPSVVEAGYRVSPKFRRGAVRAALIGRGGDAVQIAAPEAWAGAFHVDRAVDMGLQHTAWNVRDEF